MLRALTLLPQPDSPTRATVSPSSTSQETPSTARTTPPRVRNCVWRSAYLQQRRHRARSVARGAEPRRRALFPAAGGGQVRSRPGAPGPRTRGRWPPPCTASGAGRPSARPRGRGARRASGSAMRSARRCGEGHRIALRDEVAGDAIAHGRGEAARPAMPTTGLAHGHGLERDHAERLIVRRQHRDVGGDVVLAEHVLGLRPEKANARVQLPRADARSQMRLHVPILDSSVSPPTTRSSTGSAPARSERQRVEQGVETLDGLDPADVEHQGAARRARGAGGPRARSPGRKRLVSTPHGMTAIRAGSAP